MRDGAVRRAIKRVALLGFVLDLAVRRAVLRLRGKERYVLGGECRRCAQCCEAPGIRVGRLVWYLPTLRSAFLWWQRVVNGFVLTEMRRAERTFVFRCTHFDEATRSCDSYSSRPGMCRDYPRIHLWEPVPEMMPGCGYRPVSTSAKRMLRVLQDRGIDGERLEKLKKGLFLE